MFESRRQYSGFFKLNEKMEDHGPLVLPKVRAKFVVNQKKDMKYDRMYALLATMVFALLPKQKGIKKKKLVYTYITSGSRVIPNIVLTLVCIA